MDPIVLLVGMSNVVLGTVYTCYGLMTIVDMKRGWRINGFSHFGAAWIAMAFTCGPHHLDHGLHVLAAGRTGAWLDLVAILVGLPAGIAWFLLRVEAMFGGRGDRFVDGTPMWMELLPGVLASYTAFLFAALMWTNDGRDLLVGRMTSNLLLVFLYSAIGYVLFRTQVRNRPAVGGWSVSGVSLALVMYTCALMHLVFSVLLSTGRYDVDSHGRVIDIVAVPAAAYFLWVTYALYRGWLRDWNEASDVLTEAPRPEVEPVA